MSKLKQIAQAKKRRAYRTREKLRHSLSARGGVRVSVFRSLYNIYAQIINDQEGKTLVSCSTIELKELKGNKKAKAFEVGKELAKKALEKGINKAIFDRGSYLYHGRVKSLAEGLREGGLEI